MSETETILLIVLGFSLASLVALFMGRMMWTAAVRVGARRMQRQVPSSLVGLQTERDRLRAEYAMLAQRLGSRLEDAKLCLAEQMAEVSRHRNRLHDVERREHERAAELSHLRTTLQETEKALAASQAAEKQLRQTIESLQQATPPKPAEDHESRLRRRIDKLTELAKSDAEQIISSKLADAERQTRDLETELRKLDSEWPSPKPHEPTPVSEADDVIILPNRATDLKTGTSIPS